MACEKTSSEMQMGTAGRPAPRTASMTAASCVKAALPKRRAAADSMPTVRLTVPVRRNRLRNDLLTWLLAEGPASMNCGSTVCAVWLSGSPQRPKSNRKLISTWYAAWGTMPSSLAASAMQVSPRKRVRMIVASGRAYSSNGRSSCQDGGRSSGRRPFLQSARSISVKPASVDTAVAAAAPMMPVRYGHAQRSQSPAKFRPAATRTTFRGVRLSRQARRPESATDCIIAAQATKPRIRA
mmetsp:Transcript_96978/g.301566  ORF Transcript_96978/g.301566 Transcript_96978/m.301566 type:complete len:239 (-) Transcript_96978:688-1404(-)